MNILNNDVGNTREIESSTNDNTGAAYTNNTLVALDLDWRGTSIIVFDRSCGSRSTPAICIDGILSTRPTSVASWYASSCSCSSQSTSEIKCLGDKDDSWR